MPPDERTADEPLRIGILGAARITELSLVSPARALGHRLVAVAARDEGRARAFADQHGVERTHRTYQEALDDPDVEAVYNPLPNALHAEWNLAAIRAGKHVLSEKPAARDAAEAREVVAAAEDHGVVVMEAFHYPFHPLWLRVLELVASGAIGVVHHVETVLRMPAPADDDPRWSLPLAGGALMDLGCYALHAQRQLGLGFLGGDPTLTGAEAELWRDTPGLDRSMRCDLAFPSGATGTAVCDMAGPDVTDFHLAVTGSGGVIRVPDYPRPHEDDRLFWRQDGGPETEGPRTEEGRTEEGRAEEGWAEEGWAEEGWAEERLGRRSSYTYQLEGFAAAVRTGATLPYPAEDMVGQAALVEHAYRAAGLSADRASGMS